MITINQQYTTVHTVTITISPPLHRWWTTLRTQNTDEFTLRANTLLKGRADNATNPTGLTSSTSDPQDRPTLVKGDQPANRLTNLLYRTSFVYHIEREGVTNRVLGAATPQLELADDKAHRIAG